MFPTCSHCFDDYPTYWNPLITIFPWKWPQLGVYSIFSQIHSAWEKSRSDLLSGILFSAEQGRMHPLAGLARGVLLGRLGRAAWIRLGLLLWGFRTVDGSEILHANSPKISIFAALTFSSNWCRISSIHSMDRKKVLAMMLPGHSHMVSLSYCTWVTVVPTRDDGESWITTDGYPVSFSFQPVLAHTES